MKWLKWSNYFFFIPIIVGILIFKNEVSGRQDPERKAEPEIQIKVLTERVETLALPRQLSGFGTVVAERRWTAVSSLSGKVIQVHPQLKTGGYIAKGQVLFVVETVDQSLNQEKILADRRALQAEIRQVDKRKGQLVKSLEAARETKEILLKEQERYEKLFQAGATPASTVDQRKREVLNQERVITEIQSTIATLPDQKEAIRARISGTEVSLQQQGVQIGRAVVRAPFNGRLGEVYLEAGQVVSAGAQLFSMQGADQVRIEARFPQSQLANFPLTGATVTTPAGNIMNAEVGTLRENVDPISRTASVQLTVPGDPQDILLPGALVRVSLLGESHAPMPVVARSVIRNGQVFLVEEGRLARREVVTAFREGDYVAIESGLKEGDQVVTSDPGLAPDGTLVQVATKEK